MFRSFAVRRRRFSSLKGSQQASPGQRPGNRDRPRSCRPERARLRAVHSAIPPLQGFGALCCVLSPGRCPGLVYFGLSGHLRAGLFQVESEISLRRVQHQEAPAREPGRFTFAKRFGLVWRTLRRADRIVKNPIYTEPASSANSASTARRTSAGAKSLSSLGNAARSLPARS